MMNGLTHAWHDPPDFLTLFSPVSCPADQCVKYSAPHWQGDVVGYADRLDSPRAEPDMAAGALCLLPSAAANALH